MKETHLPISGHLLYLCTERLQLFAVQMQLTQQQSAQCMIWVQHRTFADMMQLYAHLRTHAHTHTHTLSLSVCPHLSGEGGCCVLPDWPRFKSIHSLLSGW